ncbi:MAG: hypothetical protein ACI31C_08860 [Muribaculaceae bacterium]
MNKTVLVWLINHMGCLPRVGLLLFISIVFFTLCALLVDDPSLYDSTLGSITAGWWVVIGLILGVINLVSILIARFAYINFEEIWARRDNWARSKVSKFDSKLRYSVSIFFETFMSQLTLIATILTLWVLVTHRTEVSEAFHEIHNESQTEQQQ